MARKPWSPSAISSTAAPVAGRLARCGSSSSRGSRPRAPNSSASVASITSFWTSPYRETRVSPSPSRRLISGSCSASCVSARCSAPRSAASTTVSSVGGANWWPLRRRPSPNASRSARRRAPDARDLARPHRVAAPAAEHAERRHLLLAERARARAPSRSAAARGDLLARLAALDLEHRAGDRPGRVRRARRQPRAQALDQRRHARAGDRRPRVQGMHERPRGLRGQLAPPVAAAVQIGGEERVVVVGQHLGAARVRRHHAAASAWPRSPPARARRPRRPGRVLLTKNSVGTRSRCSARISTRVCACTPSTADTTSTAPSSTLSTRSTSAMKSGCPGVSIRLIVTSPARTTPRPT